MKYPLQWPARPLGFRSTLLLFFSLFCLIQTISAQEDVSATNKGDSLVDIQYRSKLELAQQEEQRGLLYFNSYQRTREIGYLKLAANHYLNSISSLYGLQVQLSRKTRFYRQVQNKRLNACQSHRRLQIISSTLEPEHFIQSPQEGYCKE